jgi:LacI family transcriptional regulator
MKPNIKMISEITGFSSATVSNALNRKRGVHKETSEKIFEVAKQCGYFGERQIDNITFVIFKASGMIVTETPFFASLIEGVEAEGRARGYNTSICSINKADADYRERLLDLSNNDTTAILLLATEMEEDDVKVLETALAPIVVIDNWFEDTLFNSVLINNIDSTRKAVKHLAHNGHRKIGYLAGSIRIKNFCLREEGFVRALSDCSLEYDPAYKILLSPTPDKSYDDMLRVLDGKPPLPTAFFADNDIIALGAMKAMQKHNIRMPEDISVIGFDNLPFSGLSTPALTTIHVYKQEMGREAVRSVLEQIKFSKSQIKTKIEICTELVERDSVAAIFAKTGTK